MGQSSYYTGIMDRFNGNCSNVPFIAQALHLYLWSFFLGVMWWQLVALLCCSSNSSQVEGVLVFQERDDCHLDNNMADIF